MQLKIDFKKQLDSSLAFVLDKLPYQIRSKLNDFVNEKQIYTVNEIRIRAMSCISLIVNQKNIRTDIYIDSENMEKIVSHLCDGSIYAHLDTISQGYIRVGKGIRAGVCGKAVIENNRLMGVCDISSVNIRLPQAIGFAGEFLYKLLYENNFNTSILLYSAPGVGKTTILRDLICRLSASNKKIHHAVIDTREEITPFLSNITSDIYLSYPKGLGIELATKNMTPQIIICDEITNLQESQAIMESINSGVSLIATTHAKSLDELLAKEILKPLLKGDFFNYALGVKRSCSNKFEYTLNELK